LGDLKLNLSGEPVRGGIFLQAYAPTTGTPVGWYADGRVAAVDHAYGQGKTRLLGTMAGYGYATHPGDRSPGWFRAALAYAGVTQQVVCSEPRAMARLHLGEGGAYLWVANPTRQALPVRLTLHGPGAGLKPLGALWGTEAHSDGETIVLTAPARDVCVIALG
jgi:beta-galactosidase